MSTDQVQVFHILHYDWIVMEGGCIDEIGKHAGQVYMPATPFPEASVDDKGVEAPQSTAVAVVSRVTKSKAKKGEKGEAKEGEVQVAKKWEPGMIETTPPKKPRTKTYMPKPQWWILHGWRKLRGRKSMRKAFGQKNSDAYQLIAKRAWKKIRRSGRYATPERVAMEINKGRVGGQRAITAVKQ